MASVKKARSRLVAPTFCELDQRFDAQPWVSAWRQGKVHEASGVPLLALAAHDGEDVHRFLQIKIGAL